MQKAVFQCTKKGIKKQKNAKDLKFRDGHYSNFAENSLPKS